MDILNIHGFDVQDEASFARIQDRLKAGIRLEDRFEKEGLCLAAGVDLAYWEEKGVQHGVCCIVVLDGRTKTVVEKTEAAGKISIPYLPGFLAFRELPLILDAAGKLKSVPDVFIFDGNGCLHPNGMGIATHASFFLDRPTIGVAKSYLKIAGTEFEMPGEGKGSYTDIRIGGKVLGRALRTRDRVKPVFLSCGNFITLDTAMEVVMGFAGKESRIPLPTRLADMETHAARRRRVGGGKIGGL